MACFLQLMVYISKYCVDFYEEQMMLLKFILRQQNCNFYNMFLELLL